MRSSITTLLALALLLAGRVPARAGDLTATDAQVSTKKITLSFSVSELSDIEKVFDYGANIVKIKVSGLSFSSAQAKGDKLKVKDEHGESFYRFTRFSNIEGGGMIAIYLGKLCSPADALVVPRDGRIEVEIIKPLWKLDSAGDESQQAPANDEAVQEQPADETAAGNGGTEPVQGTPASDNGSDASTQQASNTDGGSTTAPAGDSQAPPLGSNSYRRFDLDTVPAARVEIKGLPFDEAIMLIIADSGFNVIVGEDIEDTEVNLNFTQKDLSLESALDMLCMAFDIKYSVEDDAIVITSR